MVPTCLLVRHGRTAANAQGVLAGCAPGIHLDERGREQAQQVAERLRLVPLSGIITSPLERTRQTSKTIEALQVQAGNAIATHVDDRVIECDYGDWTGQELKKLGKEPLWKQVQGHPSSVTFPGGESMRAMQSRAIEAVRHWNVEFGDKATYAVVSHGDVIKALIADALGIHLDHFQRIAVDPGSLSIIDYTSARPYVIRTNDTGSDTTFLHKRKRKRTSDAAVGGGAGR